MSTKQKQGVVKISIFITSIFVIFISISYAFIGQTLRGTKRQVITSGNLQLEFIEGEVVTLENALPMYDEVGMIQNAFAFKLYNKGTKTLNYILKLSDVTSTEAQKLDISLVKYSLTKDGTSGKDYLSDVIDNEIDSGIIAGGKVISYELRLWIDSEVKDESLIKDKKLSYKIAVEARQHQDYKEPVLNGTDPVLSDNLVPVTIASDGTVTVANTEEKWYSYENKEWANAVVLEDNSAKYRIGDTINPNDIESYFVWIPRYKYTLFSTGGPQQINIIFEDKNTATSQGTTVGEDYSHPAFQSFNGTNGLWVAKFESSYKGATDKLSAEINSSSDIDKAKLTIKPSIYSWRGITVGNCFKVAYDYLREDESHMMKNMEWGAVVYLSHSKYGKNGEVYINNNSEYKTGCGGSTASATATENCDNEYGSNEDNIYSQSTTGNISGVFDMAGGAFEYVMGNSNKIAGASEITSEGLYPDFFSNSKWDDYYDVYESSGTESYGSGKFGDATKEMGPFYRTNYFSHSWYEDYASFVRPGDNMWFHRGGDSNYNNDRAGAFAFLHQTGGAFDHITFRVVLALQTIQ